MVPVPLFHTKYRASSSAAARLLYISVSLVSKYALSFLHAHDGTYGGADAATNVPGLGFSDQLGFFNGSGGGGGGGGGSHALARRSSELADGPRWKAVVFPMLIPILVLLSGVFAGLTLGYMSLDETQLNVLSISGTPQQREYANKIKPIRKNGHLLLVTLLLANMIVNETLPVIADPVLGGGFQSVVVSTVLIVIFSEILPQSLCTRHGLYLGAKMAGFTRLLIFGLGIVSWPVAKFLEFLLGPHHGIIYRRAELKELIAMHDAHAVLGGDLKTDTVTIIGATLDLQEKVVRQAMTPIDDVFMLSIDSRLDYELMDKICQTGHSRVPVYEEVEIPLAAVPLGSGIAAGLVINTDHSPASVPNSPTKKNERTVKVKKIIGVLLVKQCVLLDPRDATPLRNIPLNKVPFVPKNESLLDMLDKFQEGRSHMAIVSRYSVQKAQSVKKAVKRGLTQRLRARVGMGDTDSSESESENGHSGPRWSVSKKRNRRQRVSRKHSDIEEGTINNTEGEDVATIDGDGDTLKGDRNHDTFLSGYPTLGNGFDASSPVGSEKSKGGSPKQEEHVRHRNIRPRSSEGNQTESDAGPSAGGEKKRTSFHLSALSKQAAGAVMTGSLLEQSMPADAVLAKAGADEFLQTIDPAVMPLGIITLEDVLEELIGEEIYDEFDLQGAHGDPYAYDKSPPSIVPSSVVASAGTHMHAGPSSLYANSIPNSPAGHTMPLSINGGASSRAGTPATGRNIPISLPAIPKMKGLGFLMGRSRSAPPVQRNKKSRQGEQKAGDDAISGSEDYDSAKEKVDEQDEWDDEIQEMREKVRDTTTIRDGTTLISNPISVAYPTNRPQTAPGHQSVQNIRMPKPVHHIPGNTVQRLGTATLATLAPTAGAALAPPGSGNAGLRNLRSASPAPSLEVILMERNRRRLRGSRSNNSLNGETNLGTTTATAYAEGVRGRGFKSSPLAPASGPSSASAAGDREVSVPAISVEMVNESYDKEETKTKDNED